LRGWVRSGGWSRVEEGEALFVIVLDNFDDFGEVGVVGAEAAPV
jgi:hypothetical protein